MTIETHRKSGGPASNIARSKAADSASKLANGVSSSDDQKKLTKTYNRLAVYPSSGLEIAVISNVEQLQKFLLDYAADGKLKGTQRQFIFQPEKTGLGPIADICKLLRIIKEDEKLIDIDSGKPVSAKFQINAFVSDLFKAAGVTVPPKTRLMRLDVDKITFLGGKISVEIEKPKQDRKSLAEQLDIGGYSLSEGRRIKESSSLELSASAVMRLAKTRIKLFATMVRDLKEVSHEVERIQTPEAKQRAKHLRLYAQEILDLYFQGQKLEQVTNVKSLLGKANQSQFENEIRVSQSLPADKCEVTPIKELMLGNDKGQRSLAAKEFVYHLSNYYQMFPKGEVEEVKTYLKYMLHPEFASMNWNIMAISARAADGNTRSVAGIHFQAPDPHVILSELESAKPGLLSKRLGVEPANLRAFLDSLKPEEKALISSAWVEHFYRNPTEAPVVGQQLIKTALGIASKHGNGVVSFEHEDVNLTSWQLDIYSAGMVGLHPNERALAYAVSGGARIMVDPKTNRPLLNIQPELVKGGEQNFELAWGFIFKDGKIPETLSIAAVKTFLLARYGTIDAIDPRDDGKTGSPSAFSQMFNRLSELEKAGIREIKFIPSRDVFFRDTK
jgi:hypothetical protein